MAYVLDQRERKVDTAEGTRHASFAGPSFKKRSHVVDVWWETIALKQPTRVEKPPREELPRGEPFQVTPGLVEALKELPRPPEDDDYDGEYSVLEDD